MGVSHKDVWQAYHWLRWNRWLDDEPMEMVVVMSQMAQNFGPGRDLINWFQHGRSNALAVIVRCPDQDEGGYPRSASHLFLRTLENCEQLFPGRAILWCEPDTVPLGPGWFDRIADEYVRCGHPFMGQRIKHAGSAGGSHMMGNSVYPANWRELAPRIASTLQAPDTALWGEGKGQPWDVWAAAETTRDLHETNQIQQIFNCTPWTQDNLNRLSPTAQLFHRCKDGTLIAELDRRDAGGFGASLPPDRRYFQMLGHSSRMHNLGYRMQEWKDIKRPAGWLSVMAPSDPLDQMILLNLCGTKGITEISREDFVRLTEA